MSVVSIHDTWPEDHMTPAKTPNLKNEPPKTRKAPLKMADDLRALNRILSILDGFPYHVAARILTDAAVRNDERRPDVPKKADNA